MKSKAIWDNGRPGIGRKSLNSPAGGKLNGLFWAKTDQTRTYSQTSLAKDDHQNRGYKIDIVSY